MSWEDKGVREGGREGRGLEGVMGSLFRGAFSRVRGARCKFSRTCWHSIQNWGCCLRDLLYSICSEMKKRKPGTRFMPGIRRREYISNELMRNARDENGTARPTIVRVGLQEMRVPNLDGSLQSQIPMEAMSER